MLALCLFVGGVGSPGAILATGETWTKPQQEVADVFTTWAAAEMAGDAEREMSLLAPAFTAWDFAQPQPMDRAAYRQLVVDLFQQGKVVACAMTPTLIQIERRSAVAHGRFSETLEATSGTRTTMQGSWSASLVRDGNKWLVLGVSWAEDRPAVDEAAIRAEVSQVMKGFIAACERADMPAAWSLQAAGPDYVCVDLTGQRFDAATAERTWAEVFSRCANMKYATTRESVLVLGPDLALDSWQGAADFTTKNGRVFRYDPLSFTALVRRVDGAWRMVSLHQSARPPQELFGAGASPANTAPSSPESNEPAVQ
jgi:ketosteroid isomerase-like protein